MGSDNLFHKRKARAAKDLKRKNASKETYDRVLIICEGTKTEPIYFNSLISDLELSLANVKIFPSPDTCPLKLAMFALECNIDDDFDRVYCVIDRDKHAKYQDAMRFINNNGRLTLANSVPCFEYWLLLHYNFSTAPFYGNATLTPGEEAVAALQRYMGNYEKGSRDIYKLVKNSTEFAIANAKRANEAAIATCTDNPTTKIGELVQYLINLRSAIDS